MIQNRDERRCINCNEKYNRESDYIGYYCPGCRLGWGERRGAA